MDGVRRGPGHLGDVGGDVVAGRQLDDDEGEDRDRDHGQDGQGGAGADWDDCISSIRIPSGWEITVFEHDQYSGTSTTFTADVPDLHLQMGPCGNDWDDCISAIQVRQR